MLRGIPGEKARRAGPSGAPATARKPVKKKTAPPPRPSGPTPEEVAAARAAGAKLRGTVVRGAAGGKRESVYIDLMGRSTRAKLLAADGEGIKVRAAGMETTIKWSSLSPRRFYGVAKKYSNDHELLAAYCRGMGLAEEARSESGVQ